MSGGILPLFTNVNTTPLWGAGGGGGGGSNSPDIQVSTITVNPNTQGVILANGNSGATAGITGFRNYGTNNSTSQLSVAFPSGYSGIAGNAGVWTVENNDGGGAYYGDFAPGRIVILGQNAGTTNPVPILSAGTNSDLTISANTSINLSTPTILQNGVPLSGSVPSALTVSSLTAYPNSATNQSYVIVGGQPNNNVAVNNVSSAVSYMDLNLRDANGVNTDLARMNLTHDYGVALVYSQNAGANFKGSIEILSSINGGPSGIVLDGANNAVLTIGNGTVQTSSFTVSSINGAVYPPPAVGVTASTVALSNFAGDTAYIPGGNLAYPLSDNFAISAGHTYRLSGNLAFTNGEAATRTDLVISAGIAGFPVFLGTLQNGDLIPANSGGAGGYQTVFYAATGGTGQLLGYNTATTTSTLVQAQSASAKWVLEDLGTI
jgi:hypothetical protein